MDAAFDAAFQQAINAATQVKVDQTAGFAADDPESLLAKINNGIDNAKRIAETGMESQAESLNSYASVKSVAKSFLDASVFTLDVSIVHTIRKTRYTNRKNGVGDPFDFPTLLGVASTSLVLQGMLFILLAYLWYTPLKDEQWTPANKASNDKLKCLNFVSTILSGLIMILQIVIVAVGLPEGVTDTE